MKISILISTYNGISDIPPLLDSISGLKTDDHDVEVIIRDDGSSDGTPDLIADTYPWTKLIRGDKNVGFVKSNNILFSNAKGDIICCVNQDTILHSDFLVEAINILKSNPDVVGINSNMIMPWILTPDEFRKMEKNNFPYYAYQLTTYGFAEYVPVEPVVRETNFITGGGFFLRRSALMENEELFDASIHMYCEDTELSLRLTRRGGKLMYAPAAVIYHNQAEKKLGSLKSFIKLFKITWTRFHVLAGNFSPFYFCLRYPVFLWGIVKKMDSLGLEGTRRFMAFGAGMGLSVIFIPILPYWIIHSIKKPDC